MEQELPFPGYHALIKVPLEASDPVSLRRINNLFLELSGRPASEPFSLLIKKLIGRTCTNSEALDHWNAIIGHKQLMEKKLERVVSIQAAAVDYANQPSHRSPPLGEHTTVKPPSSRPGDAAEEWLHRAYSPGYHVERLRDEVMRSKRYHHALSAIMVDIDEFHKINEQASFEAGDAVLKLVVGILKMNIRAVDIIARYSGDCFLVILPNTNKREAVELAERLRLSIAERTARARGAGGGVTASLSVGQSSKEDQAIDFMKKLEAALEKGKRSQRNAVYQF